MRKRSSRSSCAHRESDLQHGRCRRCTEAADKQRKNRMEIIDADGHVNDIADQEAIAKYMPAGNRSSQIFPVLDHLHFNYLRPEGNRVALENPGPQEWVRFLDQTEIS